MSFCAKKKKKTIREYTFPKSFENLDRGLTLEEERKEKKLFF